MSLLELIIIAVSLSMDAFGVAVCKGLSVKNLNVSHLLISGGYFGGFQALMPLLGYILGVQFRSLITGIDHWIICGLLTLIGINMIRGSFKENTENTPLFSFKAMFPLALATSIDALAVGVTLAVSQVRILPAVTIIGVITFTVSVIGVKAGNVFGTKYKSKAEFTGGLVLILMGLKILIEDIYLK